MEIKSKKIRELKQYKLENREAHIEYLYEILTRIYKLNRRLKKYLNELRIELDILHENSLEYVDVELYTRYLDLLDGVTYYLLNVIGDRQQSSISYAKYRDIMKKKLKNGFQEFPIRPINEDIEILLNHFNKIRNFNNHVPEALLASKLEYIDEGKFIKNQKQPIIFWNYSKYSIEILEDLYAGALNLYNDAMYIESEVKKDYSVLIGESLRIINEDVDSIKDMRHFEPTKLAGKCNGL